MLPWSGVRSQVTKRREVLLWGMRGSFCAGREGCGVTVLCSGHSLATGAVSPGIATPTLSPEQDRPVVVRPSVRLAFKTLFLNSQAPTMCQGWFFI